MARVLLELEERNWVDAILGGAIYVLAAFMLIAILTETTNPIILIMMIIVILLAY